MLRATKIPRTRDGERIYRVLVEEGYADHKGIRFGSLLRLIAMRLDPEERPSSSRLRSVLYQGAEPTVSLVAALTIALAVHPRRLLFDVPPRRARLASRETNPMSLVNAEMPVSSVRPRDSRLKPRRPPKRD